MLETNLRTATLFVSAATSLVLLLAGGCSSPQADATIKPVIATDRVSEDPDDPAIWVHPTDPGRSLILGTNKTPAPGGALVIFGVDGKTRQTIDGIDRPNNVDVEYGLVLGDESTDIAVLTERLKRRLRVFRIAPDGSGFTDISAGGGLPVFEGEEGEHGAPMGIALYRRPRDGAVFAIVSRKTGPKEGYLWQYRIEDDGAGRSRPLRSASSARSVVSPRSKPSRSTMPWICLLR